MDEEKSDLTGPAADRYSERGIQDRASPPFTQGASSRERLRAAKEYAEMIVDSVREGLLILDLDLRVQAANQSFYDCFQVDPDETVGRKVYNLGSGQWDIPELRRLLEEILPGRKVMDDYEVNHGFKGIGQRAMLLNARQVDDHELVLLAIEDVTERRQAQEALRKSEERYRTLFNSIDEGFCVVEVLFDDGDRVDYRFLETNSAFEEQTGLTGAEGKRMRDLAPEHEEHWFATYGRVASTGESIRFVAPAKELGPRWYDVYAFRVGSPEKCKVAILFNDITKQKQAKKQLQKANEELEQLNEALKERTRQVHALAASLIQAEEKERERIADILHEDVQQQLVGAHMLVQSAKELTRQLTGPSAETEKTGIEKTGIDELRRGAPPG